MHDVLVRGQGVGRTYGTGERATRALTSATFEVRRGERIALVGPSGSGKSTLVHLMAGIDVPSEGSVAWPALGDRRALRPGPVAVAFQGRSLLPPLSVAENVALPLLLRGDSEAEACERAGTTLADMGLEALADKLPEELSGGQAQRVALARALVTGPLLLLADEPTGQLDHEHARRTMELLLALSRSAGTALVIATHDGLVAGLLDKRWEMRDGRLEREARHV